jgi:CheY-like chemotaxis protein
MKTTRKVLVVDDYRDLLEFLGKVLAVLGWHAVLADSAREALNKLEYGLPSVILLDMRMAGMSGFEVAGILKKHPVYRKIPILAARAYPGHLARRRSLTAGCDDFISKPFAISALQTRLTRLVSAASQKAAEATRP